MNHLAHLKRVIPEFGKRPILDVGAGRGDFVISAAQEGFDVTGLEFNPAYLEQAREKADSKHLILKMVQGEGECLPFSSGSFGFVNLSEVIEHVRDPQTVLSEVYRVLHSGGCAYISAPNRFGIRDPHFHLYFLNWFPRKVAHRTVGFLGKHKKYTAEAGLQRIDEMHYYTFGSFCKLLTRVGFKVLDIREIRIRNELPRYLRTVALVGYWLLLRPIWFDTAHVLAYKEG